MEDKIKVNDQFKIVFSIVKEISEDNMPKAVDYGISNGAISNDLTSEIVRMGYEEIVNWILHSLRYFKEKLINWGHIQGPAYRRPLSIPEKNK